MSGGHRIGEKRRLRGRLLSSVGAVGAFIGVGLAPLATAPSAHADLDDLITQPLIEAFDQAANLVDPAAFDPGAVADAAGLAAPALDAAAPADFSAAFAPVDSLLNQLYQALIYNPVHELSQWWAASPFGQVLDANPAAATAVDTNGWLFGDSGLAAATANPAAGVDTAATTTGVLQNATVPLAVNATTEPAVNVSIGGGPSVPLLIDTGSNGVVLPWWDVGLNTLFQFPTGFNIGAYSGGLGFLYATYPETISFGNDTATGTPIVTDTVPVNVVWAAWPTSLQAWLQTGGSWQSFWQPAGVDGVLGIGPNAQGPDPVGSAVPTEAFSGNLAPLGQGVLIDQAHHQMVFGPNPLTGGTTVTGAPISNLLVSIDGGAKQHVQAIIDSGGVYGTMPNDIFTGTPTATGTLPVGTTIQVYDASGQHLLYSYDVTNANNSPIVIGPQASTANQNLMNTGNMPFAQGPVYISNAGNGAMVFGGSPN